MQITLKEAADLVDGAHHGPDHMILRGAGTLSSARQNEITFIESKKMLQRLEHSMNVIQSLTSVIELLA